ncbi:hypothetical protein HOT57_gp03 [Pseudomonas phage phCDa]|uniref:Uncharacterized protein n=1 Tax=Pseudomonas phage phCDa TaxID=2268587 RepID=A0A2Z5H9R1_9CAUD|nr:hypothetical protein HOT57_gp03 [Pseudomonas phage phCDa]AXC36447.1 hypothetical protein phCDa_3 [Pseudomonas phage phCDa]
MKLTLSHADISLALCEFLANRGMTAFDPAKVTADFSFKRGSKELVCELDSEPKAPLVAPVAEVVTSQASTTAPIADSIPETPAQDPVPPAAEQPAESQQHDATPVAASGDDDNLFD